MPGGLSRLTLTSSPVEAAARALERQPKGSMVAVALSGGGDSVGLLCALYEAPAYRTGQVGLAAITVDHGLRAGSAGEAAAMAVFCQSMSIPHLTMAWEGEKPETGLSAAAREARYRLLAEGVERFGADCLMTAHTLDDQLETVEMRRQRSETSVRGLAGIAPTALFFGTLAVHRPFLHVRRADIRAYLTQRDIRWIDDPSNDNPQYERVRLRQGGQFALNAEAIAAAARRRLLLSEAAAHLIDTHATMPLPMLFRLDLVEREAEAFSLALATLIAVAGGQTHLPGQETLARTLAALQQGRAVSLGRTVIERRKEILYIGRDRRNLPLESVGLAGDLIWDGRFRFGGEASVAMSMPASEAGEARGVPPRIAQRAFATLPEAVGLRDGSPGLAMRPFLSPFETVISSFDAALAQALCRLTGRMLFPGFLADGLETFPRNG